MTTCVYCQESLNCPHSSRSGVERRERGHGRAAKEQCMGNEYSYRKPGGGGHIFCFKSNQEFSETTRKNRETILDSAGVIRGSMIWQDKMTTYMDGQVEKFLREIAICSCHIRMEDVKQGRKTESWILVDGARAYTSSYLKNRSTITEK